MRKLELGTVVYLTGRIFTAREGVYKRAVEDGAGMPAGAGALGTREFPLLAGGAQQNAGRQLHRRRGDRDRLVPLRQGSMGRWLEMSGCNIIIGKGGMTSADLPPRFRAQQRDLSDHGRLRHRRAARTRHQAVAGVYWLKELGLAQAVWVLDVENFGPFLVESDLAGNQPVRARERQDRAASRAALCRQPAARRCAATARPTTRPRK